MANESSQYDAFVSYDFDGRTTALRVIDALRGHGVTVVYADEVRQGANWRNAIWEAMTESQAFVLILSGDGNLNANVAVEVGAAMAWNKPIYAIVDASRSTKIPDVLADVQAFPMSRIADIASMIIDARDALTEDDKKLLSKIYSESRLPVDKLQTQPQALAVLTQQFNQLANRHLSGEQILRALLNLRKRGSLTSTKARDKNN
jgi:hypothetical protein